MSPAAGGQMRVHQSNLSDPGRAAPGTLSTWQNFAPNLFFFLLLHNLLPPPSLTTRPKRKSRKITANHQPPFFSAERKRGAPGSEARRRQQLWKGTWPLAPQLKAGSEHRATVVITERLIADRTFQQPVVKLEGAEGEEASNAQAWQMLCWWLALRGGSGARMHVFFVLLSEAFAARLKSPCEMMFSFCYVLSGARYLLLLCRVCFESYLCRQTFKKK